MIALLAILAIGASAYLIKQLNAESGGMDAVRKNRNAEVLNRAKQALIGYIAAQAAKAGEDRPGALPCPEAPGNFNDPANEGTVSYPCTPPTVGRFPWRTLGLDKLVDSSGEPLWYVVSAGWAGAGTVINSNCASLLSGMTCASSQLTVDGTNAIALIIAPGPAFSVPAATGCAAWNQVRPINPPAPGPDWRNYLECENASNPANATFVTTGPSGAFNDQVVKITAEELLPAIEAAIASRIEREIAPQINRAYSSSSWPLTTLGAAKAANGTALTVTSSTGMAANEPIGIVLTDGTLGWTTISAVNSSTSITLVPNSLGAAASGAAVVQPVLPFALTFANPAAAASYAPGVTHGTQGILPLSYSETAPNSGVPCTPSAAAPRCQPLFVAFTGGSVTGPSITSSTCSVVTTTFTHLDCTFRYTYSILSPPANVSFTLQATTANAGVALRQFNTATAMTNVNVAGRTAIGILNASGSATISLTGTAPLAGGGGLLGDLLCGIAGFLNQLLFNCYQQSISVPIFLLADHPLVDSANGTYGWFLRNRWHEVSYYAVAPGIAPGGGGSCITSTTCLTVNYHRDAANAVDAGKQRAIIVLSGRSLTGAPRPNGTLTDWLEGANAVVDSTFELRSASLLTNRTFNDRFAVLDSNP